MSQMISKRAVVPLTCLWMLPHLLLFSRTLALNVGALLDSTSYVSVEQRIALEVAAQSFNSSQHPIYFQSVNISAGNPLSIISAVESLTRDWEADVIISSGPWVETSIVADVIVKNTETKVPLVSLSSDPLITWKMPPNLISPFSQQAFMEVRCIADLVKLHNWRRTIVIFEDDAYGSVSGGIYNLLSDELQAVGSGVDSRVVFTPLDATADTKDTNVRHELEELKKKLCKVFIVLRSSQNLATEIFMEANSLKMISRGYVWITNEDISSLIGSAFSPGFSSSYMQGVIGIRNHHNTLTDSYKQFNDHFQQLASLETHNDPKKSHYSVGPSISALCAYDAMHAVGQAAAKGDGALFNEILSSDFEGLSGQQIMARGAKNSTFEVINVVGNGYRTIGYWSSETSSFVDTLSSPFWPGGEWKTPGGWGKLKIGIPTRTTFDKFVKVESKEVTGYCIDVFKATLGKLKYDLDYEFVPFNGTYDELVDQVYENNYNAVVGDITILADRSMKVDFTHPYLSSGLAMLVRVEQNSKSWLFTKPFTIEVWLAIAAAFSYTAITVWYLEHEKNPEFEGSYLNQAGATLWLVFSTFFFSHGKIYSYYTKATLVVWLFTVLILINSYIASLSSMLTVQKLKPLVNDNKVGCDGDSFVVKYLNDVLRYTNQQIVKTESAENYTKFFEAGNITAAYLETPYLRVFLSQHEEEYTVHGETHKLGGFGFVFSKGSPITKDVSEAIMELTEEGTLSKLEKQWFSLSFSNCPEVEKTKDTDSLSLGSFWGLFIVSGGTSTMVLLLVLSRKARRVQQVVKLRSASSLLRDAEIWKTMGLQLSEEFMRKPSIEEIPSSKLVTDASSSGTSYKVSPTQVDTTLTRRTTPRQLDSELDRKISEVQHVYEALENHIPDQVGITIDKLE